MFKAMILLQRKASMTPEEFRRWWLGSHAPLAKTLPGVKRAVFNLVDNEESEFDGVSELWFETQLDFEKAYESAIGQAVAADSINNVSKRERLFVVEHEIIPSSE